MRTCVGSRSTNRVNRGGSWNNDNPSHLRGANRNRNTPDNRNNNLGLRCASTRASFRTKGLCQLHPNG
ncbi:MAG: SUMF1/EgtB/PvdO family nonheme iron enzyme [Polyangiaceae bacterium]|nr:SUMF1/EgtB/PvdO family nonheme iron enzyme [Polyangiaceae bacterium]